MDTYTHAYILALIPVIYRWNCEGCIVLTMHGWILVGGLLYVCECVLISTIIRGGDDPTIEKALIRPTLSCQRIKRTISSPQLVSA